MDHWRLGMGFRGVMDHQYVELATILEYAAAHGVSGEWVTLLKRRLAAYKRRAALNEALASTRGALASARDRLRAGART